MKQHPIAEAKQVWEIAYQLNPGNPDDAALDSDDDGMLNLAEFRAGTNPRDSASRLWLEIEGGTGQVQLRFSAQSNKSYSVQHQANLGTNWTPLTNYNPAPTNRIIALTNSPSDPARFYRVVTPAP